MQEGLASLAHSSWKLRVGSRETWPKECSGMPRLRRIQQSKIVYCRDDFVRNFLLMYFIITLSCEQF